MSKVLTFSTKYPAYHSKKGEPTYFVEKIHTGLLMLGRPFSFENIPFEIIKGFTKELVHAKFHTIRSGRRWKAGDYFSPRIWSGKAYNSKQIVIAPDIRVEKTWEIDCEDGYIYIDGSDIWTERGEENDALPENILAQNDGLTFPDLCEWLQVNKKTFDGQIICWNKDINYSII